MALRAWQYCIPPANALRVVVTGPLSGLGTRSALLASFDILVCKRFYARKVWSEASAVHLSESKCQNRPEEELAASPPSRNWRATSPKTDHDNLQDEDGDVLRTQWCRWSEEESANLMEMKVQGKKKAEIMARLPGHSWSRIIRKWRKIGPRTKDGFLWDPLEWTDDEVHKLLRLRESGHGLHEIMRDLPGRTSAEIRGKYAALQKDPNRTTKSQAHQRSRSWTANEVQRLVRLRLRENRTWSDISRELNRSISSVNRVYAKHKPKHERERRQLTRWSAEEITLLKRLHNEGLPLDQIAAKFPGRSAASIRQYRYQHPETFHLGHYRTTQRSLDDGRHIEALKRSGLTWAEISKWYPNDPLATLRSLLWRWRQFCAGAEELRVSNEEQREKT